jgi:uncharacterized integral membrane protein
MQDTPETAITEDQLPPHLKRLRVLVTVLTLVMIGGVITITALLVIRLTGDTGAQTVFVSPDRFDWPDTVGLVGYSVVGAQTVLIGDDGIIRVFDTATGTLAHSIAIPE